MARLAAITRAKKSSATDQRRTSTRSLKPKGTNHVTEDEADIIVSLRRLRTNKEIPVLKVLKRYGYRLDD